jgi:hypothetical protein
MLATRFVAFGVHWNLNIICYKIPFNEAHLVYDDRANVLPYCLFLNSQNQYTLWMEV